MPINDIAPAIMGVLIFMIPIIAILTGHQRKMAELIHGQGERRGDLAPQVLDRIASLEREVVELKDLVRRHVIATDDLRAVPSSATKLPDDLPSRIGGD
jgi:hypothetical protein